MPVSLLLIEDNEDILANLYAYLEPLGYELDCARHGRAGLDMAARGTFDCIVLDIMRRARADADGARHRGRPGARAGGRGG